MRRKREVLASRIDFIDAYDCGSTVGYSIRNGRHGLSGAIYLTDCNRKIDWYFSDKDAGIAKIDKAIEILVEFRNNFKAAKTGRKPKK